MPRYLLFAPLALLLSPGCSGEVVGQLALTSFQSRGQASFNVEPGTAYRLWERYQYDDTGWRRGPKRRRCYRWKLLVTQKRDATHPALQRRLSCATFTVSGCTSSSHRSGWRCQLNDCDNELTFPLRGQATIAAEVAEGSCQGGRDFSFAPKIVRLQLQLVKPPAWP